MMGDRNSSVTRVWPIFDLLFARDPIGRSWLRHLIAIAPNRALAKRLSSYSSGDLAPELANFERKIPSNFKKDLKRDQMVALGSLRNAFERESLPTALFLEWLIKNPDRLSWPEEQGQTWLELSEETRKFRQSLKERCSETMDRALMLLAEKGGRNCALKWWAFEGATNVDCWLETNDLILLVEGKRTEEVSSRIQWFEARDQVVRNLEVAAEQASQAGKQFAVLLCAENCVDIPTAAFEQSLPHLSAPQRQRLFEGYLGCVTWEAVRSTLCSDITLPDGVSEAVEFCLWARHQ